MLKTFAHCWLILSLLIAPVQFASADMAALDYGQMKCDMMDMNGSMDRDMSALSLDGGCECPDSCKVSCTAAHISLATNAVLNMFYLNSSVKLTSLSFSIVGTDQIIELRPPRKLHA